MDNYDRLEIMFRVAGWRYWWEENVPPEPTIDSFSVTMHVVALEHAVCRRASNQDPFDSEWKKAMSLYGRDSRARFWNHVYTGCKTGPLRMSLMDIVINEAMLALHGLSIDLNEQFTSDSGWVFYLLETRLGETFKQIHKDLPKEGFNSDEEGYEPIGDIPGMLPGFRETLRQARDQVIKVIKRINSSREPTQGFQIFDISNGIQVNDEDWERHSQCLTQGDDREGPRGVILSSKSEPAGLGGGYISWTATKETLHLVGFSTLPRGVKWEGGVESGES
ncbi:hypothetical protein OEA41_010756 [Lepraria neglecta]|uniref:Uncharacterized protein n=1 Tax=Lepraria neglecta TaxID=209136 RepID=A0AAD9YX65_9LECA|nr:hypothetical protein OEA41_010756 [Lepraria neglecta]